MNKTIKKWITTHDNHKVSFVHVARPEKEIICFPSQIGCGVRCSFCISSTQPFIRSLTTREMLLGIEMFNIPRNKTVLYSCMGQGEPFENLQCVIDCFVELDGNYALSTARPTRPGVKLLNDYPNLNIKVQASFSAGYILASLRRYSGPKEVNVILIEGADISGAIGLAGFIGADNVKLTTFNNWNGCTVKPMKMNIEMYTTDGIDLGASCGQQNYLKE
ncbi:MAG: hypothetical protein P9L97_05705 [Candidatus Tenebribacter davisii]|nr:hypothetical protein [Candidatus Tenebribacter davisii]